MVNILIIDSVSGDRENCIDIQISSVEPTQDYIDHTNGVIDIINEEFSKAGQEVKYTTVHIAENLEDPYWCKKTQANLNRVLDEVLLSDTDSDTAAGFAGVYLGVPIVCKTINGARATENILERVTIPIVCPGENSAEEREKYADMIYVPECGDDAKNTATYVCSIKNSWPGMKPVEGIWGTAEEKQAEYTSKLAAIYLAKLLL